MLRYGSEEGVIQMDIDELLTCCINTPTMQTDACFIHINKTPVTVMGETGPGGELSWVVGSY